MFLSGFLTTRSDCNPYSQLRRYCGGKFNITSVSPKPFPAVSGPLAQDETWCLLSHVCCFFLSPSLIIPVLLAHPHLTTPDSPPCPPTPPTVLLVVQSGAPSHRTVWCWHWCDPACSRPHTCSSHSRVQRRWRRWVLRGKVCFPLWPPSFLQPAWDKQETDRKERTKGMVICIFPHEEEEKLWN